MWHKSTCTPNRAEHRAWEKDWNTQKKDRVFIFWNSVTKKSTNDKDLKGSQKAHSDVAKGARDRMQSPKTTALDREEDLGAPRRERKEHSARPRPGHPPH